MLFNIYEFDSNRRDSVKFWTRQDLDSANKDSVLINLRNVWTKKNEDTSPKKEDARG